MINTLIAKVKAAAHTVLPEGTPAVQAIPPALQGDMVGARRRLQGALLHFTDGSWALVPPAPSTLGAGSKKITLTLSGDISSASEKSDKELAALHGGVTEFVLEVITDPAGPADASPPRTLNGLSVALAPVVRAEGMLQLELSLGGVQHVL